jgi:hypothetical protein
MGVMVPSAVLPARAAAGILAVALSACTGLLPRGSSVTQSPWTSYHEAQAAFERIVPNKTTIQDLKPLRLDPESNPNIVILNYSDVLRRFVPPTHVDAYQLDAGVRDCIAAKTSCRGYEVNQQSLTRQRNGSFWLDFLGFTRTTHVTGWRFNGVLLLKDGVVVYKLTGGQPSILEHEESTNPLGPLQGVGESQLRSLIGR